MSSQSDQNHPDLPDPANPEARVTEVVTPQEGGQTLGPGVKLNGRYLIDRELGRGGIGVVYLARDERLHFMPVVIKFLLDASGRNAWLATKFLQEAEALTRINHPSVVKVIDRDTSPDGRPFFVMEFVGGRPLRSVMKPGGMDLQEAAPIIRQIGQGLAAAHQHGIVHRDLKPENILLQHLSVGEEQVKLIDFGIAKVQDSQSGAATEVSIIAGSLQYIAPEQINSQPVSAATDIYTFAIVAYEMLTGRRPFETTAPGYLAAVQQMAALQQGERMIAPRELRPDLPASADALIRSALSFAPERRPQDARSFGDQLAKALTVSTATERAQAAVETTEVLTYAMPPATGNSAKNVVARKDLPKWGILGGAAACAVLILVAFLSGIIPGFRKTETIAPAATKQLEAVPPSELILNYSVTVQKDPKRYPGSKPFQLPGEVIFSPGDRIHLSFSSPQAGHLYIINEEEPTDKTRASSYNVLFPPVERASGSAIAPGDSVRLPERGDGFVFDEQEGVEKLWLVFGTSPIALLESIKRFANPDDAGRIRDGGEIDALRTLLADLSRTPPVAEKSNESKQTTVRTKGTILARLVRMEHH